MASFDPTHTQPHGRLFGGRLSQSAVALIGRLAAWNDARVTRNALSRLSDRELYDIGLVRGDIDDIRR
ncbi:uncharacterized protein Ga0609869_003017 [Rhodovulum iodosum]|uniref:YjiS-like domain-containing protein n=1 Tax=Rhodovulum iodosum TaxID=68291 RepID=A0ABV3XX92_9RHOB|nr:DUF1127 domain-containing protein [Rhodovulum robiginosum]RSK36794.1 DUF1127 domain-containing protein [Rhodovulum robiginosum]